MRSTREMLERYYSQMPKVAVKTEELSQDAQQGQVMFWLSVGFVAIALCNLCLG
ncbi:MAG: hypothetical protein AAGF24_00440 [Cyanobacteria bacterium P01_H01_bin.121]